MKPQRERDPLLFAGTVQIDGMVDYELPAKVRAAQVAGRFRGKVVEVEIREFQEKRSRRQNDGFHAMIAPWARSEGHRIDDLKRDLLKEIFGTEESVSLVTGEAIEVLREPHTSTLTVRQFCELIERALEIAAWSGVVLVAPNEYKKAKEAVAKKAERDRKKVEKGRAA